MKIVELITPGSVNGINALYQMAIDLPENSSLYADKPYNDYYALLLAEKIY